MALAEGMGTSEAVRGSGAVRQTPPRGLKSTLGRAEFLLPGGQVE